FINIILVFILPLPPPPSSTLFPYTTLFRSFDVLLIAGTHARFIGTATVNGVPGKKIQVDVDDLGEPGSADTFSIEVLEPGSPRSDRKSTRLNSSHVAISYAVFCLKKKRYQP